MRSTGPSAGQYPRGQRLAPGATVSLKAADIVTILDRAGTRVLRGPGTFRLDGAVVRDNGVAARLSRSLVNGSLGRTLRAGAVRGLQRPGAAGAPLAETIWLADVDQGGAVCVPRDSSVFLWRGNAGSARSGALASADQQVRVAVTWPARTSGVEWPLASLPLRDGNAYRFTDGGSAGPGVTFTIVAIDPVSVPGDAAGLGALLLDKGCNAQFDRLADSLEGMSTPGARE